MDPPTEIIKVRISPDNRRVSTSDLAYRENWVREFEKIRDSLEKELKSAAERGEIKITVNLESPLADTPEKALHFLAHSEAEKTMQRWAIMGGIGVFGTRDVWDHGTVIEYIDDPTVPLFGHQVVQTEE